MVAVYQQISLHQHLVVVMLFSTMTNRPTIDAVYGLRVYTSHQHLQINFMLH